MVHGGIRLLPADKLIEIDNKTYHVIAERKLKYGTVMIADKMVKPAVIRFEHPLTIKQGYLVFEVKGEGAKLIDAEPTHIMVVLEHVAYFRRAEIKVSGDNVNIVYSDWVSCGQHSIAMAVAFVPIGSRFTACYNTGAGKHRCREILATVPPVIQREFFA